MDKNNKRLIVVGDRVLIHMQEGEERTKVGLYLPPTAMDSQAVQGGKIVATGPGLRVQRVRPGARGHRAPLARLHHHVPRGHLAGGEAGAHHPLGMEAVHLARQPRPARLLDAVAHGV